MPSSIGDRASFAPPEKVACRSRLPCPTLSACAFSRTPAGPARSPAPRLWFWSALLSVAMTITAVLKADQLSATHGGAPLFTDVNVTIGPGDRLGLVGPNGVGKSTLL